MENKDIERIRDEAESMAKTIVISNKNKYIISLLKSMEARKAELIANMEAKIAKMAKAYVPKTDKNGEALPILGSLNSIINSSFISGAHYEHAHLQTEIDRLKGLIEEAYNEGQDAMFYSERGYNYPDDRPMPLTYEQFKTKHKI